MSRNTSQKTQKYVKKDPISHCLDRPDMYIGSTRPRTQEEFVVVNRNFKIQKKQVKYSPGILRIFIEPLSNVIDNVARSKQAKNPVTKISIEIDEKTGLTSFWNDGEVIPIEIHSEEKCYNHTLIFGHLLTSSNYNDNEERYDISGRNGVGVKLTNVFSRRFTVQGSDPVSQKYLSQTWSNNMRNVTEPKVKTSKLKKGYTKIEYLPDFERFKLKGYTRDILAVYKKYIIDTAMITGIPVYFNGEKIHIRSLVDYAHLYSEEKTNEVLHIKTKNAQVVLTPANAYQTVSFANGVCTTLGGVHVDEWSEKLFRPIVNKLNKPKKPQISIKDVKGCFRLFVVASVKNPRFESQSKLRLEEPLIKATVRKTHIAKICKWSIMERLEDIIKSKEFTVLKKVERKRGFTKIEKLDRANKEGGRYGRECTLILVEGDSAKTYAVYGIDIGAFGKQGRDWFGIYALRGKILNVRNASPTSIAKNAIVVDIIKALGLKQELDYTEEKAFKTLRYGRVLTIADADVDGVHINSLIQNLFHTLFPSLLNREEPFLTFMQTHIASVKLNRKEILFYDEREFNKFAQEFKQKYPNKKLSYKYFKGLGSSDQKMIAKTFGKKIVYMVDDEHTTEAMNKAFHKKHSDSRKNWLAQYNPENIKLKWNGEDNEIRRLKFSDFIDTELIKFSLADCKRSIPHVLDGLKESQRKILYVAFKKKLEYNKAEKKVAQFGAQVALHSGYHHGEQNLFGTLIKMVQEFPGSNNIPLFYPDGQFGSRLEMGSDAASPRYINTKLEQLTRLLFPVEDNELLKYLEDDGESVEPDRYVPIIPMILINGITAGIGTGWSCSVPCYNPFDVVEAVRIWIENDGKIFETNDNIVVSLISDLDPWYNNWKGIIEMKNGKYVSKGIIENQGRKKVITELPIGMATNTFKNKLDNLLEAKQISDYENNSTVEEVKFTITESQNGIPCNEKNLKLTSYIHTSNMVMFTDEGLKKFETVEEIISYFCEKRLELYKKRKRNILNKLKADISYIGNKKRFMKEVIEGKIKLFKKQGGKNIARPIRDIVRELEERKYDKVFKGEKKQKEDEEKDEKEEEEKKSGYDYLLNMQFRSITQEKINKLEDDLKSKIKEEKKIKKTNVKDIWLDELEKFEDAYELYLERKEKEREEAEKERQKALKKQQRKEKKERKKKRKR